MAAKPIVSPVSAAIIRGERAAQRLRPATLTYSGVTVRCAPGNHDFFEVMADNGAGRIAVDTQPVRVLRCDLPLALNNPNADIFSRGQGVKVKDLTTNEELKLVIAKNNSWQSLVLILMLESQSS